MTKVITAAFKVEYSQAPSDEAGAFIEVRRWIAQERSELVLEFGRVDEAGDLSTTVTVMPFHYSCAEVLASLGVEG